MKTMRPQQPISAIVADVAEEQGPILHRLVDKRQCRLGVRAELGDDLVVHLAEPCRMAHPRRAP